MKISKLLFVIFLLLVINFVVIYILFLYRPPHEVVDIDPNNMLGVTWDLDGNRFAYFEKQGIKTFIKIYDFVTQITDTISLQGRMAVDSSMGFSPDSRYLTYYRYENDKKMVDMIDLQSKVPVFSNSVLIKDTDILITDNGASSKAVTWLDDDTIIYESYVPFGRGGILFLNFRNGQEIKFINQGIRPALSENKKYLVYAKKDGLEYSIYKLNLENDKEEIIANDLASYVYDLNWSPDDEIVSVYYKKRLDNNENISQISIIKLNGDIQTVSQQMEFIKPTWIDDNSLLMAKYEKHGIVFEYRSVSGIYLYNIETKEVQPINKRERSGNYYLRPNSSEMLYKTGGNVEIFDLKRVFSPSKLDLLRSKLGIFVY